MTACPTTCRSTDELAHGSPPLVFRAPPVEPDPLAHADRILPEDEDGEAICRLSVELLRDLRAAGNRPSEYDDLAREGLRRLLTSEDNHDVFRGLRILGRLYEANTRMFEAEISHLKAGMEVVVARYLGRLRVQTEPRHDAPTPEQVNMAVSQALANIAGTREDQAAPNVG